MHLSCFSGAGNPPDLCNCDRPESDEIVQANLSHDLLSGHSSRSEDYQEPLAEWITYGACELPHNDTDIGVEAEASSLPRAEGPSNGEDQALSAQTSHIERVMDGFYVNSLESLSRMWRLTDH